MRRLGKEDRESLIHLRSSVGVGLRGLRGPWTSWDLVRDAGVRESVSWLSYEIIARHFRTGGCPYSRESNLASEAI
jgi:hypothetical protein